MPTQKDFFIFQCAASATFGKRPERPPLSMQRAILTGLILLSLVLAAHPASAQYSYRFFTGDNSTYTINDSYAGYSVVGFGSNSDAAANVNGSSPTVYVVDPAIVGVTGIVAYNNSRIFVSGGVIGSIDNQDNSSTYVSGGDISLLTSGGAPGHPYYTGYARITGGTVSNVNGVGTVDMYGGTVHTMGAINANVYGGTIDGEFASVNGGTFNVYGGTFPSLEVQTGSALNLYGGDLQEGGVIYDNGGDLNIFGSGLSVQYVGITYDDYSKYALSGTLSDGAPLNDVVLLVGQDAPFNLDTFSMTPEPSCIVFLTALGLSGGLLLKRHCQRK